MRWYFGEPSRVEYFTYWSGGDSFVIMFDYDDFKYIGTLNWSKGNRYDSEMKVHTSRSWITVEEPPPLARIPVRVTVYDIPNNRIYDPVFPWKWHHREELTHFINCIVSDQEPKTTPEDAAKDLYWVDKTMREFVVREG